MPAPKGHPNYNTTGKGGRPSRLGMVTEAAEIMAQSGKRMKIETICDRLAISDRTRRRWTKPPPNKSTQANERFCRAISKLIGKDK